MTSPAEGQQEPHPDSPEGKRLLAEEIEAERDRAIAYVRVEARRGVGEAQSALTRIARSLDRLDDGPGNLYDVEYAEGQNGPKVAAAALAQARVALAALYGCIPRDDV